MLITTPQLIQFLIKAQKIGASFEFNYIDTEDGYVIDIFYKSHIYKETFFKRKVFISKEGYSNCSCSSALSWVDEELNPEVKEYEKLEEKNRIRRELIDSLTPEQRELLGL